MLGGLARWLRILGYEATYYSNANDTDLLRVARNREMILLTRDEELCQRADTRGLECVLVNGETEIERLAQLAAIFHISLEPMMKKSRCPECGTSLRESSKNEVSSIVPATSLKLYDQFWKCANQDCAKVYWIGSHWKQMRKTLNEAKKLADSQRERP